MPLEREVSDVLLSSANKLKIDKIHFVIEGVTVDPAGLRQIGKRILSGGIEVGRAEGATKGPLGAAYTPALDKLSLSSDLDLTTVIGQAAIVHECTHALVDMRKYHTTEVVDEMAGYIADAIFMLASHHSGTSPDAASRQILTAAAGIVKRLDLINADGKRPTKIIFDNYKDLSAAIHAHPAYQATADNEVKGDGVREKR